jgi:hypothetical protein
MGHEDKDEIKFNNRLIAMRHEPRAFEKISTNSQLVARNSLLVARSSLNIHMIHIQLISLDAWNKKASRLWNIFQ